MKRSVKGTTSAENDQFIPVKDYIAWSEFLRAAKEAHRRKHPEEWPSLKRKEGRPSKEASIHPICDDLWKKYRRPPTLGKFIAEVQDELDKKGIECSANTVRKHALRWLQVSLSVTEIPPEMLRRNASAKECLELTNAFRRIAMEMFSSPKPVLKGQ